MSADDDYLMSASEFAAFRGVSVAAVSRAVDDGRLKTSFVVKNGCIKFKPIEAMAEWNANTKPNNLSVVSKEKPPKKPVITDDNKVTLPPKATKKVTELEPDDPPSEIDEYSLVDIKKRRELAQAKIAEHELSVMLSKTYDSEDIEKAAFEVARVVRDGLMNVPNRVADKLVTMTDRTEICKLLEKEIRQVLEHLVKLNEL